jgi:membrane-bound lytic murein transglycosylase MltF
MTTAHKVIKKHTAKLTPKSDTTPVIVQVDDSARLREIRKLVHANNLSGLDDDLIIAQIYMESRFDPDARASGSSARGLMQLLKVPVRELYRLENNDLPRASRKPESSVYAEADRFHNSPQFVDEGTNIQTGTKYLSYLVRHETSKGVHEPVVEAYKDYRGVRNGIYYRKIKAAADRLVNDPENMQILRDMVK